MSTRMRDLMTEAWGRLRYEPLELRVRAALGGSTIVDSTRAALVWEPRRVVPSYAVPADDIRAALDGAPAGAADVPGVLHPGIPFGVHTAAGEPVSIAGRTGAGFRFDDPDLDGYVALDFDAFEWLEEDEPVRGHPRDPYHRVEVRRTERPLRIELDGELIAETTQARLVRETSLPLRFYLPREDVQVALQPSARRTFCPYKGEASYWSTAEHADLGWSYEQPLADMTMLAGLIAFWDERVDVVFDGERRSQPGGAVVAALRDEFGV